jgi:uncharacterized membrane protein (DUF485 family)
MVSPEPGVPSPAVNAHSYTIPSTLLPATALPRAAREGLIDIALLVPHLPPEDGAPIHWTARFFTPMGLCIFIYCCAMAALAGYARGFMAMRIGPVNGSCLFVFSQLLIAWIVAAWYVRAADIFADPEPLPCEARNP